MFRRFFSNLKGAILILTNPRYLKERVDSINSDIIDLPTGLAIVAKSEHKLLDSIVERYPTDSLLKEKVEDLKTTIPEEKDELKTLILERKNLESMKEKACNTCHRIYLLNCVHSKETNNK